MESIVSEEDNNNPSESNDESNTAELSPLEAMTAERDKLKNQLLRVAADFDNFRKRSKRELDDSTHRAREDVLREVLPVIDNLERAAQAAESASDPNAVAEGVRMVLRGFDETQNRLGLRRVNSVGQMFDPTMHDAMQQIETTEHPPGTIIAEIVPGYQLRMKLLRPAMVVVAKAPAGDASKAPSRPPADDSEKVEN
ncbi:MAG: nucleotide exchange factor GrpE [Polyangiales bacterium]